MAFWDAWFKTPCSRCKEPFARDALIPHEAGGHYCAPCTETLEKEKALAAKEVEERRAAEEAALEALKNRNTFR